MKGKVKPPKLYNNEPKTGPNLYKSMHHLLIKTLQKQIHLY